MNNSIDLSIDFGFIQKYKNIFVACSGGMDSVFLCTKLLSNNIPFSIVHCNFKLRGIQSDLDESFVKEFSAKNNLPFFSKSFDTVACMKKNKTSLEIEARNLRYNYFKELTESENIDLLLTAHHKSDQVETILMRIAKGTGISGLKGIPKFRPPNFYRPLLDVSKKDIIDYVLQNKLKYREDQSNSDVNIIRNFVRHKISPLFCAINEKYEDAIAHISSIALQSESLMDELFSPLKKELSDRGSINIKKYQNKPYLPMLIYYLLEENAPNRAQVETISKNITSTESKKIQINSKTIEIKNGYLYFVHKQSDINYTYQTIEEFVNDSDMYVEILHSYPTEFKEDTLYFDIDKIKFPIIRRVFQQGDSFKKYGMKGKSKKLSDYFQDMKLSLNSRNKAIILEDKEGEIIAVFNSTISEKVKITKRTQSIMTISSKI